ncbi:ABC transporter permease [Lachnospiraceae bacterium 64-25]|nr:ribose import permease protein RbsC [Lachnospiraceae bacterium]
MKVENKINYKKIFSEWGILIVLILVGVTFTFSNENFLTFSNVINIFRQMAVTAIVAIGMTFIMVSGDIDVGVGGVACLTGMVISLLMSKGIGIFPALLAGIVVGILLGALNGFLVTKFNLPPMVVTLATMNLANGIASLLTGGTAVYGLPEGFLKIGRGSILGIPNQVWVLILFAAIASVILNRTPFGRHVYAIGGNKEVAKLAGIHVKKVKIILYIVSGICASVGGIILSSRTGSGQPTLALTMNMNVITAVAIGGTSLNGGSGSIRGSIMGAMLLTMITNGLNVNGINSYWQLVVSAVVLILTIIVNRND